MGEAGTTVQAIGRSAPDVAALDLAVPALAYVAIVVPRGSGAAGPASRPNLALRAGSTGRTDARVARDPVYARGAAGARIARAIVHVDATVRAREAGRALASEPIDAVDTLAAVQARQQLTVVDVAPAVRSLEALTADASVAAVGRVHACRAVLAGVPRARRRCRDVAGRAVPAGRAVAREAVSVILTGAAVPASARFAVAAAQHACLTFPAAPADTREIRHAVHAGAVVAAWLRRALVQV